MKNTMSIPYAHKPLHLISHAFFPPTTNTNLDLIKIPPTITTENNEYGCTETNPQSTQPTEGFYSNHVELTNELKRELIPLLGAMPDYEIAKAYNLSRFTVGKYRTSIDISPYYINKPYKVKISPTLKSAAETAPQSKKIKRTYTKKEILTKYTREKIFPELGVTPDTEIAAKHNITTYNVRKYRISEHISPYTYLKGERYKAENELNANIIALNQAIIEKINEQTKKSTKTPQTNKD